MAASYVMNTASWRGVAMQRFRVQDPTTYTTPKQKRVDGKFFAMGVTNELGAIVESESVGKRVQVKNTTGGSLPAGTLATLDTNKLSAQTSAVAVNNPLAGASVVINVAATFEVGQLLQISGGGNTDYAYATAVSAGASVTVDLLFYDYTTPTVTALPAYEISKASATGVAPAEWVLKSAIANGAYGFAYDNAEVTGIDTSALTVENLLYLDTTAGGYTASAPTGADVIQQIVGVVKKSNVSGSILFFPGNKRIVKVGSSYFQTGAVAASLAGGAANTVFRVPGGGGTPAFGAIDLTQAAAVSGILGSSNGGTANAFVAISGPAASIKTYALPNATCAILTDNAAVTAGQGGTGNNNAVTSGFVLVADGSKYVGVAMSGDVTIATGGATAIGAGKVTASMLNTTAIDNRICDGRLTLVTSSPVVDATGISTLFFTPYIGNRIAIFDGTNWKLYNFTERSIGISGFTGGTPVDVFIFDSAGTPTLELLTWSSPTARATAIVLQDGVYVKSGATTRRYLGTILPVTATTVSDNPLARGVWNYCNRVRRAMAKTDTTDSWTYTTATWRAARGDSTNCLTYCVGVVEDSVRVSVRGYVANSGGPVNLAVGVGVDSTSVNSAQIFGGATQVATVGTQVGAEYSGTPAGVGVHTLTWLEISSASGTTTWLGDNGGTLVQTGIVGEVMA